MDYLDQEILQDDLKNFERRDVFLFQIGYPDPQIKRIPFLLNFD